MQLEAGVRPQMLGLLHLLCGSSSCWQQARFPDAITPAADRQRQLDGIPASEQTNVIVQF
jgi:hypothetical protein